MSGDRKMILGAVMRGTGSHSAGWRYPDVSRDALRGATGLQHYVDIAKTAEAAKLDFVFLADTLAVTYQSNPALLSRAAQDVYLEPFTVLSAVAAHTSRIGLVATLSTSFTEPFNAARLIASLDHLSEGRAGWNVVTSFDPAAAQNYSGDPLLDKGNRFQRAQEFVDVVKGLWDSWEEDALVLDQAGGRFVDPAKVHRLDYESENFKIAGPLNIPRSPQGQPIIFVAGASAESQILAAKSSDAMFSAQPEVEAGKVFYENVKSRLPKFGRRSHDLAILIGAMIITGKTDAEAEEKRARLRSLIDLDFGLQYLSSLARVDLRGMPLDQPIPDEVRENATWSRIDLVLQMGKGKTLRDIALDYADTYGHQFLVGGPGKIADYLQMLFEEKVADGFLLRSAYYPGGLEDITGLLVPELQRRGLFRTEYEGASLRDHLGLEKPVNSFCQAS